MPWYYAGPEAKPVGPVSLEELQARRQSGAISPETYVIEHTGQPNEPRAWKRYREVFPSSENLPPLPPIPVVVPGVPPPAAHPLFPSAAAAASHPASTSTGSPAHLPPPARKTNSLCAWGFGLGIAGLIFSLACGVGVFPAAVGILVCFAGLAHVKRHPEQGGKNLAIAGLIFSAFAMVISLIIILAIAIPIIKERAQTATEQTSNSSE